MFAPLLDQALFKALCVDPELKTIVWPNGADLDPGWLHAELADKKTWSVPF